MGTGPSKLTAGATAEQKSQIGVFVLGRKESYAIDALSTILTKMLEANRLFDINKLLSDKAEEGCSSLFMVIQNAIDAEFMRLKFQDPKQSSTITGITTVPTAYYKESLKDRTSRTILCNELARFLVRLVTLIAALAASIKTNREIKSLLQLKPTAPKEEAFTVNRLVQTVEIRRVQKPMNGTIPDFLKDGSFLTIVEKDKLLVIKGTPYAIDLEKMILYDGNTSKTTTPAFTIEIIDAGISLPTPPQPTAAPVAPTAPVQTNIEPRVPQELALPQALAPVPVPQVRASNTTTVYTNASRPGQGPLATSSLSSASPVSQRRSTRRRKLTLRRSTRRVRRQRGGGPDKKTTLFRVSISSIGGATPVTVVFLVNALGDTYENTASFATTGQTAVPVAIPIQTRLGNLFKEAGLGTHTTQKLEEVDTKDRERKEEKFMGLQAKDRALAISTISSIKGEFDKVNKDETGTAPAPYRAFLLASEPVGSGVFHMLCNDAWRGKWVTNVLVYSLFQSLFNDEEDGKMSPRTAEECRKMMKAFTQTEAMRESVVPGATASSFSNLRFADLSDVFKSSVCAQTGSESPKREESVPGDVAILRKAHNDLRLAYEAYIDKVIPFTMSIVKVVRALKDGVQQEVTFKLDPAFFTTEGTSLAFLEKKIAEARVLIGSHLLTVEKIYFEAMKALELSKKGIAPRQ